jgi:hypothetical protein
MKKAHMHLTRWLCSLALMVPSLAAAQGTLIHKHEATTAPLEARYEIVQSSVALKVTLRLDRQNGVVDQLVSRPDSTIGWEPLVRRSHRDPDTRLAQRANYQIFTSGLGIRYTFLINVNTGATWQLVEDPAAGWFWTPIF